MNFASAVSSIYANRSEGKDESIGMYAAPAFSMPIIEASMSGVRVQHIATMSPLQTPARISWAAIASLLDFSAPKVTVSP